MESLDKFIKRNPGWPKTFYYTKRFKKKKNGKKREIFAPSPELKTIQKEFAEWLYEKKKDKLNNKVITGFMPNKSIIDNARPHLNKEWVVNLDVKDFFPTITIKQVEELLKEIEDNRPLWQRIFRYKEFGFKNYTIDQMADLLTLDGKLIQGSPASPIIANLIGKKIDSIVLTKMPYTWTYTRYADDLTLSMDGGYNRSFLITLINDLIRMIEKETIFKVNPRKINIKHRSQKQEVTGIVVSSGSLGVSRWLRNNLKATIYYHKKLNKPLDNKILGILNFIHDINKDQYNKLMGVKDECNTSKTTEINE